MCIYIYIYIHTHTWCGTGVCEKNTPLETKTPGKLNFNNTKSGAGVQFLQLCCKAKARVKGVLFRVMFRMLFANSTLFGHHQTTQVVHSHFIREYNSKVAYSVRKFTPNPPPLLLNPKGWVDPCLVQQRGGQGKGFM